MNLGITGKTALVAAASRGLGKAVAMRLAAEGAEVALCSRNRDAVDAAAADITKQTGGRAIGFVADVTRDDEITQLVRDVNDHYGPIEILIPNAGGPPAGLFDDFGIDDYRRAVELNLMSTINLCYAALPAMRELGWGRIVAITSVAARQPEGHLILSNTARAGALGFLKSLATQVAAAGITVNAVCPGYTRTERITELAEAFESTGQGSAEDFLNRIRAGVPMRRMGTPEEFADTVAFLASDCASYVTGVALPIDGGYTKALF
jgi:3-oxoacyl-[acyl-carrier protein] reductase